MGDSLDFAARQILTRGTSAFERDDYGAALNDFRTVLEHYPNFADVRNKAGLCLALLGSPEAALGEFEHAIRVNPSYVEAHLNRAIVLNDLGRFPAAREAIATAWELEYTGGEDRFRGDVGNRIAVGHARLGDLYAAAGADDLAVAQYSDALRVRPHFVDIRGKLAQALLGIDRTEDAKAELEAILEENPHYTGARIQLGVALQRIGDIEGAVREWTRASSEAPGDLRPRAYLATLAAKEEIVA